MSGREGGFEAECPSARLPPMPTRAPSAEVSRTNVLVKWNGMYRGATADTDTRTDSSDGGQKAAGQEIAELCQGNGKNVAMATEGPQPFGSGPLH